MRTAVLGTPRARILTSLQEPSHRCRHLTPTPAALTATPATDRLTSTRASSSTSAPTTTPATGSASPPGSPSSRCAAVREPRPDWVVTSQAADRHRARHPQDRQGGRRLPARAGRPRRPGAGGGDGREALPLRGAPDLPPQHHLHRGPAHPELARRPGRRRRETAHGRAVAAGQWAWAEWETLTRLWLAGLPVPYPVQIDGTEILMELVQVDGEPAPRLAQTRPGRDLLASYFEQVRDAHGRARPARAGARRPLAVQPARRGRAAGAHRPPAGRSTSSPTRPARTS